MLWPEQLPVYSSSYPDRDQKIRMSVDSLQLVSGTTNRYQFVPNCYLALAAGALGEAIPDYESDTDYFLSPTNYGIPGPLTFNTVVPNSYEDVQYLIVNCNMSAYGQYATETPGGDGGDPTGYIYRVYGRAYARLYYQLPNLSYAYVQSSTFNLTTAFTSFQLSVSGLSGLGPDGFGVLMYFSSIYNIRFYESNQPAGNDKITFLGGNTISYQTNVTGSETLLTGGVIRWQAMGE